jgi:hypothetical protein
MDTRALLSIGLAAGLIAAACGGAPNGGGFALGEHGDSTADDGGEGGSNSEGGSTAEDASSGQDAMTGSDDSGSGDSGTCNAPTCAACVIGNPCCTTKGVCGCTLLGFCL